MKHIYKPLYLILLLFFLDKLFLIPVVQKYTVSWKMFEPEIYRSRKDLFEKLQQQHFSADNKTGIILGSSRSAWFDNNKIREIIPNSTTYNFSAPLGGPAWYYYWLQKILLAGIPVSFVIIEADAILFTEESLRYQLTYSFDPEYIIKNTDFIELDKFSKTGFAFQESELYFEKYLFALFNYPFDFRAIRENFSEIAIPDSQSGIKYIRGYELKDIYKKLVEDAVKNRFGSIGNPYQVEMNSKELEADIHNTVSRLGLTDFKAAETQVYYYNKLLKLLAEKNIKSVVFRPPATEEFRRTIEQNTRLSRFHDTIYTKIPGDKVSFVDPMKDKNYHCSNFTDSYHISGSCFPVFTQIIIKELQKN